MIGDNYAVREFNDIQGQSSTNRLLDSALMLHQYLLNRHWTGQALVGPDPGIRFNARIGRFIKSYLHFLPWADNLCYMQAQSYWIMDNWLLLDILGDQGYSALAISCAETILEMQHPDGFWEYPNPEWRDRIATVEGCFAALGLLECYERTGYEPFLKGAEKWHHCLINQIGFHKQPQDNLLAIKYFAHDSGDGGGVPNNSTLVLWNIARLAALANDDQFIEHGPALIAWLDHVQCENGELPYAVGSEGEEDRIHFLCYQYNAFEFMDLVHYYHCTGDQTVWPIMKPLAGYLAQGITPEGAGRYDCNHAHPEVVYYTSAIARSLSQATTLGLGDFQDLAECAFTRVLSQQRKDGRFQFHSSANYGILSDARSYPRYLAMTLNHLLREYQSQRASKKIAQSETHI